MFKINIYLILFILCGLFFVFSFISSYLISKRKYENDMRYGILYRESVNNQVELDFLDDDSLNDVEINTTSTTNTNLNDDNDKLIEDYFNQKRKES